MYTPHTQRDIDAMLAAVGVPSLEELVRVPDEVALKVPLQVPPALAEADLVGHFEEFAKRNAAPSYVSFLGAGTYRHYAPPAVAALAMRGEFLTSYTPYQAEVSQGYLQAIYEWQTYIALLTGMDVANASVYDGATALAEGAIMALNATGRKKLLVSRAVHPNYRAVLKTYADGLDVTLDEIACRADGTTDFAGFAEASRAGEYAAAIVQSPNFFGTIDIPDEPARAAVRASGTLLIGVVAEALSLAILRPPGEWGAAIAVGEAQSFGVAPAYGGPHVGFIASTHEHVRRIPGRLVGRTVDKAGHDAFVLTLQAREQHIRREKATSNICTNQAHCALIATIYLALLGKTGLRICAAQNVRRTRILSERVAAVPGCAPRFSAPRFNEVAVRVPSSARDVLAALQRGGVLGGVDLGRWYPEYADSILMAATELTTDADIDALCDALAAIPRDPLERKAHAAAV